MCVVKVKNRCDNIVTICYSYERSVKFPNIKDIREQTRNSYRC